MRLLAALVLCAVSAGAESKTYRLGPVPGNLLKLEVFKTGLMNGRVHVFEFPAYSGQLEYDPEQPETARVTLEIDTAPIQLKDDWLSASDARKVLQHATQEMLGVAQHPKLRFESKQIQTLGAGRFRLTGDLTIRSITRPVTVEVEIQSGSQPGFTGAAAFKMTAYGLKPPSAALGAIGTRDEMRFTFRLTGQP